MNILDKYSQYCNNHSIPFEHISTVSSYDTTTLFCSAGMQKYKEDFMDNTFTNTLANSQACLRLNDLDSISDGSHCLYFNMLGLFSFRDWSVQETIIFWMGFVESLGLEVDTVTIHPDKYNEWKVYYAGYDVLVKEDIDCIWSDGNLGGYCTEFYVNGVEIGNIVNTNGDCIDVGFGLERLEQVLYNTKKTELDVLQETITTILGSGVVPSNKQQGYILRKLLRLFYVKGGFLDAPAYHNEVQRQKKLEQNYYKLKDKYPDKPKTWWFDTHGIDLDLILIK